MLCSVSLHKCYLQLALATPFFESAFLKMITILMLSLEAASELRFVHVSLRKQAVGSNTQGVSLVGSLNTAAVMGCRGGFRIPMRSVCRAR